MDLAELGLMINSKEVLKAIGTLNQFVASTQKAEDAVEKVENATESAGRSANRASGMFKKWFADMGTPMGAMRAGLLGIAGALGLNSLKNTSDDYTNFTNRLKVAGVEAEKMAGTQSRLAAAANRAGAPLTAMSDLYSRMAMNAKGLGASQETIMRAVDGVSAALKVNGGSVESASGALMQMGQALGSGTVRAEEFNSMLEGAQPILQAVADGHKGAAGSIAKLRQIMLSGGLSSKEFFDAFIKGSAQMEERASKMSMTIGQGLQTMRNGWTLFIGELNNATGISGMVASGFAAIGNALTWIAENIGPVGIGIASVTGAVGAMALGAVGLTAAWGGVVALFGGPALAVFGAVSKAILFMNAAVLANPWVAAAVAVTALVGYLVGFETITKAVGAAWAWASEMGTSALATMSEYWAAFLKFMEPIGKEFDRFLTAVQAVWAELVKVFGPLMQKYAQDLFDVFTQAGKVLYDAFSGFLSLMWEVGKALAAAFGPALLGAIRGVWEFVMLLIESIRTLIGALGRLLQLGNSIDPRRATSNAVTNIATASAISTRKMATGGLIQGPGTGTSDSVPIMGSDGEFIVNAKATDKYRSVLEAINNGTIEHHAAGGIVGGGNRSVGLLGAPGGISSGGDYGVFQAMQLMMRYNGNVPYAATPAGQADNNKWMLDYIKMRAGDDQKKFEELAKRFNVTIVNKVSPDDQLSALDSKAGGKVVQNLMRSDPQTYRSILGIR